MQRVYHRGKSKVAPLQGKVVLKIGTHQLGVSAERLQKFLPEAVQGDDRLSIAHGQAALVACAELAEEIMRLRALLQPVK